MMPFKIDQRHYAPAAHFAILQGSEIRQNSSMELEVLSTMKAPLFQHWLSFSNPLSRQREVGVLRSVVTCTGTITTSGNQLVTKPVKALCHLLNICKCPCLLHAPSYLTGRGRSSACVSLQWTSFPYEEDQEACSRINSKTLPFLITFALFYILQDAWCGEKQCTLWFKHKLKCF